MSNLILVLVLVVAFLVLCVCLTGKSKSVADQVREKPPPGYSILTDGNDHFAIKFPSGYIAEWEMAKNYKSAVEQAWRFFDREKRRAADDLKQKQEQEKLRQWKTAIPDN